MWRTKIVVSAVIIRKIKYLLQADDTKNFNDCFFLFRNESQQTGKLRDLEFKQGFQFETNKFRCLFYKNYYYFENKENMVI